MRKILTVVMSGGLKIVVLGLWFSFQCCIVTTFAKDPPQQGIIIQCEECVILYPGRYLQDPESCSVCDGRKEHFQPARMMDSDLVAAEARELEYRVENSMIQCIIEASQTTATIEAFNEIRDLYMQKLRFHLIYGQYELEPIRAHIMKIDAFVKGSSD